MPVLLYATYPAPQIIQAVINILNKLFYPSKIPVFQQCCSDKNLIYNLNLLEVVCSDYFLLVPYQLLREGVQAFMAAVISWDVCRSFLRLWPPVTPNPDFSTGEFFLTAVMVVCGENCNWLSNPLHLLICSLGSQMTAHKYIVKKGGTAPLRSENAVSYALIRLQVPWGRALTPTLQYFMYQTE